MFAPVERSMMVSAPQRMPQVILSTSSSMEEVTAELPRLPLIFTRKLRPMIIGSDSGWLILQGMIARLPEEITPEFVRDEVADVLVAEDALDLIGAKRLPTLILADGDKFHLRGDDPLAGVVQLGDVLSLLRAPRRAGQVEAKPGQGRIVGATPAVVGGGAVEPFRIAALLDPGPAQLGQAPTQVDLGLGVAIGAGGVVDQQRRVLLVGTGGLCRRERDLAEGHADIGA